MKKEEINEIIKAMMSDHTFMDTLASKMSKHLSHLSEKRIKCPECGKELELKARKDGSAIFVGCTGYPDCNYLRSYKEGNEHYIRISGNAMKFLRLESFELLDTKSHSIVDSDDNDDIPF